MRKYLTYFVVVVRIAFFSLIEHDRRGDLVFQPIPVCSNRFLIWEKRLALRSRRIIFEFFVLFNSWFQEKPTFGPGVLRISCQVSPTFGCKERLKKLGEVERRSTGSMHRQRLHSGSTTTAFFSDYLPHRTQVREVCR